MDKSAILAGFISLLVGTLILLGEYLCVEVAWKCSKYQAVTVSIGLTCLVVGFIFLLSGYESEDARNDL